MLTFKKLNEKKAKQIKKHEQSLIIFFLRNTFFKQIFRGPVILLIVKLWQYMSAFQ